MIGLGAKCANTSSLLIDPTRMMQPWLPVKWFHQPPMRLTRADLPYQPGAVDCHCVQVILGNLEPAVGLEPGPI